MSAALGGIADILIRVREALDGAQIPFMIAGSFASTTHGFPRTTQDLDIVIDPANLAAIESFLDGFSEENYYFDRDAARDAFRRRSMFNLVDQETGWKIDIIIRKRRAFSESEFTRRQKITIAGVEVFVASAEDTIVPKAWPSPSGRKNSSHSISPGETFGPNHLGSLVIVFDCDFVRMA